MPSQRKKPAAIGTKAPYPGFIETALATSVDKVPSGQRWIHEVKFDGYRVQVHLRDAVVKVFTRRGNDWTNRFRKIAADAWHINAGSAIIDGEVVIPSADGTSDFSVLQNELKGRSTKIVMVAFDLLYLNGYDLRKLPLLERKKLLKKIIADIDVQFSESFEVDGREMYNACSIGLEGVVSKVRDSRYISGGANSWVKKTCAQRETLPVTGFALKQNNFDGIYVGRRGGKELVYAGKIDQGFDTASAKEMQTRLNPLICKRQPYAKKIAHRGVWGRAITLGRNRIPRQVGRGQSAASVLQGLAGGYVMKTMIEYEELPRERRLRDASQEATGWKFETIEHDEMTFPAPSEGPMRKAGRVFT